MRGGCSDQGEILTRFPSPAPDDVVRLYDDPILRRVAREVTAFDENLRRLGDRLLAIQTRMRAVGVAAVQIAVAQSVFSVNEALVRRRGEARSSLIRW